MGGMTPKPQALLTTPADAAWCSECEVSGIRYGGDVRTYPHCPLCGTTDLLDTRSPWEVLAEAKGLVQEALDKNLPVETYMSRQDTAHEVARVAALSDC